MHFIRRVTNMLRANLRRCPQYSPLTPTNPRRPLRTRGPGGLLPWPGRANAGILSPMLQRWSRRLPTANESAAGPAGVSGFPGIALAGRFRSAVARVDRCAAAFLGALLALVVVAGCSSPSGENAPATGDIAFPPPASASPTSAPPAPASPTSPPPTSPSPTDPPPAPPSLVSRAGQEVFAATCAVCHGADGQGQPNWHIFKEDGTLPPPPLNGDGHTWHHSDGVLYRTVSEGGALPEVPSFKSGMPALGDQLSHQEIVAVITYVKSLWGDKSFQGMSKRESQSLLSENDPFPPDGG